MAPTAIVMIISTIVNPRIVRVIRLPGVEASHPDYPTSSMPRPKFNNYAHERDLKRTSGYIYSPGSGKEFRPRVRYGRKVTGDGRTSDPPSSGKVDPGSGGSGQRPGQRGQIAKDVQNRAG